MLRHEMDIVAAQHQSSLVLSNPPPPLPPPPDAPFLRHCPAPPLSSRPRVARPNLFSSWGSRLRHALFHRRRSIFFSQTFSLVSFARCRSRHCSHPMRLFSRTFSFCSSLPQRAFITGRIIKQFFTPEARKVKKFVPLSAGLGC